MQGTQEHALVATLAIVVDANICCYLCTASAGDKIGVLQHPIHAKVLAAHACGV